MSPGFFCSGAPSSFAGLLLSDRRVRQLNGRPVMRVGVKQRALTRRERNMHHKHEVVLEDHVMMRLLFNRDRRLFCHKQAGKYEDAENAKNGLQGFS